jgi:hypothetical protein
MDDDGCGGSMDADGMPLCRVTPPPPIYLAGAPGFVLLTEQATWAEADTACGALPTGGSLATFTSLAEWEDVLAALIATGQNTGPGKWVGYTDAASEGTWRDVYGGLMPSFMDAAWSSG